MLCISWDTNLAIFVFVLFRLTFITAEVGFDCTLCGFPERGVVWMAKPTRVITPFHTSGCTLMITAYIFLTTVSSLVLATQIKTDSWCNDSLHNPLLRDNHDP